MIEELRYLSQQQGNNFYCVDHRPSLSEYEKKQMAVQEFGRKKIAIVFSTYLAGRLLMMVSMYRAGNVAR